MQNAIELAASAASQKEVETRVQETRQEAVAATAGPTAREIELAEANDTLSQKIITLQTKINVRSAKAHARC